MPRKRRSRVYLRGSRYWGDFRDYITVGGKLEALVPPGDHLATTDLDVANKLAGERLQELERRKRGKDLFGIEVQTTLREYSAHHLMEKARAGKVTTVWLERTEDRLRAAVEFFGDRELSTITTRDVQRWTAHLRTQPAWRGKRGEPSASGEVKIPEKTLSSGTVRHYLNALSNVYQRAQSEGFVLPGYNPVAAMMEKPTARREEAAWLEVPEAALFLEAARTYRPKRDDIAIPNLYEIIATFLLTGGRQAEVLGLETADVSFDRGIVTFRPHSHRRLKTGTSFRSVPLWPQLEEILRAYVFGSAGPAGRLLFPASRTEKEQPVTDIRKALDAVGKQVGWKPGEIRTKMFRHTYCAARLQTLDHGAPVPTFTVARELGHGGTSLVERVYGHLGTVRHRSEAVEYRVEQHRDVLGGRDAARDGESPDVERQFTLPGISD
jgi:integrase